MKKLVTALVALGLVAGCVAPTLAAEHKTKASCEKAHMKWDALEAPHDEAAANLADILTTQFWSWFHKTFPA